MHAACMCIMWMLDRGGRGSHDTAGSCAWCMNDMHRAAAWWESLVGTGRFFSYWCLTWKDFSFMALFLGPNHQIVILLVGYHDLSALVRVLPMYLPRAGCSPVISCPLALLPTTTTTWTWVSRQTESPVYWDIKNETGNLFRGSGRRCPTGVYTLGTWIRKSFEMKVKRKIILVTWAAC